MDAAIIIDDDFTIEVEEESDEENLQIKTEPRWEFEYGLHLDNDVHIKEEFDIDFEDNYVAFDKFINLQEIKTELEDERDVSSCFEPNSIQSYSSPNKPIDDIYLNEKNESQGEPTIIEQTLQNPSRPEFEDKEISSQEEISSKRIEEPLVEVEDVSTDPLQSKETDVVCEEIPKSIAFSNQNEESISQTKNRAASHSIRKEKSENRQMDIVPESLNNISTLLRNKESITSQSKNHSVPLSVMKQKPQNSSFKSKSFDNFRKNTQPPHNHRRQPHNEKSLVPVNSRRHRKIHRNYRISKNPRFFNFDRNFNGGRLWNSNFTRRVQSTPPITNRTESPTLNWQTYSTILSALNQLVQTNQNAQYEGSNAPVPFKRRGRNSRRSKWHHQQLRRRPQVWASECENRAPSFEYENGAPSFEYENRAPSFEYENRAPSFECSTQLQMYTTILRAVTQLNNGVQNYQNFTCMNNITLQMNVFKSF